LNENNYSILHLATHGFFGGTAQTSYLLAFDREISMVELEKVLKSGRQSPSLLVLSACETSLSSKLSVLGLAGVAAKSGVGNVIGSLWQIQDENQTKVVEQFYANLNQDLSNTAIALQKVQVEQIHQFAHPQEWAALNLIGNY
jgi:CHAT domain-containing protein